MEGEVGMKKLFTLIALIAGAVAVGRKVQAIKEEQDLWTEATDTVPPSTSV
jgi:hypothetical protein